ncbi:hypothetical protein SLS58_006121 [Diplodia intermedia]|uniref:Uncharacterized protein n=1 Tax=Diplodia intermedia TaxID=856260 RepID=A0ABR3TNV6_9PEZI
MSFAPTNEAPECIDMQDLESCMHRLPYTDNGASLSSSREVLDLLRSDQHIHVHGARLSADEYLHLGTLIYASYERVRNLSRGPGIIIIVDDIADSFASVTALASHITRERPTDSRYSNANVSAFSRVAVVRGPKPAYICPTAAEYRASLKAAASAAKATFFIFTQLFAVNSAIWHSHNDPSLVLYIINTFPCGSPPIAAISVFNALLFTSPSSTTNSNNNRGAITLADPRGNDTLPPIWPPLINATERAHGGAGIPLAFFSSCSLRVPLHRHDIRNLSSLPSHLPALLPESAWKPPLGAMLDDLVIAAFRLLAGGGGGDSTPVGAAIAEHVQRRLHAAAGLIAGRPQWWWARRCLDPRSYGDADVLAALHGALVLAPDDDESNLPPTLAALHAAVTNPSPSAPATALARLAVGRYADADNVVDDEDESLWAIRATLVPRSSGDVDAAPADSVTLRATAAGSRSTVHVITTPPTMTFDDGELADAYRHPRAVLDAVCERWERYVGGLELERGRRALVRFEGGGGSGGGGTSNGTVTRDGFGVGRETAEAWMAVVDCGEALGELW